MYLFNRFKNSRAELLDDNHFRVFSMLSDTYHEISITLIIRISDAEIVSAEADFRRHPLEDCGYTATNMQTLIGLKISKGFNKLAAERVSGSQGCTHLADLIKEAANAFVQARFTKMFKDVDDPEIARADISHQLEGNCYSHSKKDK